MSRMFRSSWFLITLLLASAGCSNAEPDLEPVSAKRVLSLINGGLGAKKTLREMEKNWHPGYTVMLLEMERHTRAPEVRNFIARMLVEKTKTTPTYLPDFYQPIWRAPYMPHPEYASFKAGLYRKIDPRFAEYFADDRDATIRLDEIRWGGVRRDGIPPLKNPKMLTVKDANYLEDSNIVFGIEINGDARAYPKRVLAWHEMFKDTVGGDSINGVYCTLCGSMIIYYTELDGVHHELGTSGFLYRSNKLMYDHATTSMWNTLTGEPVVGPLVGQGIKLKRGAVVTTTWGEWKRRHPDTTVLSLDTGHRRNYGEGVAYNDYFATDELMFDIPDALRDLRLKNKAEILALLDEAGAAKPVAISADWLRDNPLVRRKVGEEDIVILTDRSGANRVFRTQGNEFVDWDGDKTVTDSNGQKWEVKETALCNRAGTQLGRYPSHRAFWFGWRSAYPESILVN